MNIFRTNHIIFIFLLSLFVFSCTELINIDDQLFFEDAIVIEASITNEYKYHKISLARTFKFEGPFWAVLTACGNCTTLGTNIKFDFWLN